MRTIQNRTTSKAYYKKYAYRIKYDKLSRFTQHLLNLRFGVQGPDPKNNYVYWLLDYIDSHYPINNEELDHRLLTADTIQNMADQYPDDIKVNHGRTCTTVYFTEEDLFDKCKLIGGEYQIEYNTPSMPNMLTLSSSLNLNEILRNSLFFKEFRYKVHLDYMNYRNNGLREFLDSIIHSEDIKLCKPLEEYMSSSNSSFLGFTDYVLYCKDDIALSYCLMVGGKIIKGHKKAILPDEVS